MRLLTRLSKLAEDLRGSVNLSVWQILTACPIGYLPDLPGKHRDGIPARQIVRRLAAERARGGERQWRRLSLAH